MNSKKNLALAAAFVCCLQSGDAFQTPKIVNTGVESSKSMRKEIVPTIEAAAKTTTAAAGLAFLLTTGTPGAALAAPAMDASSPAFVTVEDSTSYATTMLRSSVLSSSNLNLAKADPYDLDLSGVDLSAPSPEEDKAAAAAAKKAAKEQAAKEREAAAATKKAEREAAAAKKAEEKAAAKAEKSAAAPAPDSTKAPAEDAKAEREAALAAKRAEKAAAKEAADKAAAEEKAAKAAARTAKSAEKAAANKAADDEKAAAKAAAEKEAAKAAKAAEKEAAKAAKAAEKEAAKAAKATEKEAAAAIKKGGYMNAAEKEAAPAIKKGGFMMSIDDFPPTTLGIDAGNIPVVGGIVSGTYAKVPGSYSPSIVVSTPKDLPALIKGLTNGQVGVDVKGLLSTQLDIDIATPEAGVANVRIASDLIPKLPFKNAASGDIAASGAAESDWSVVTNMGSGESYYYNANTGETQYEKPANF